LLQETNTMTDKKDPPSKDPDKRGNDSTGAKRPYATLDLKATEVRTSSSPGAQPTDAAKPAGKPAASAASGATASPGATTAKDDQTAAATRVAAAAAAFTTPRSDPRTEHRRAMPEPSGDEDAAPPNDWRSYGSHALAGVVGGLLALTGGLLLAPSPKDPRPAGADAALVQAMSNRIAALEQAKQGQTVATLPADAARRLAGLESGLAQVGELNRAITALRESQAKLGEQGETLRASLARSPDREMAGRIDKLQEQLTALAAMAAADPQSAGRVPQLAQILGKVNDLETALNTRLATLRKDMTQEVEARTASVAEASEAAKSGVQRLDRDVAGTRSETARIGQRLDTLKAGTDRLDQSLRSLQADAATLKTALDGFKTEIESQLKSTARPTDIASAVAPLSAKITAFQESLQGVVRADDNRKVAAERIVLSLELGNLKRALDRGGSYAAELASVKKRGGASFELGALERYQHDGVPSDIELAREFQSVANAIIDADAEQPDASLMDRLLSGARTIVRVRKVTHAPGDNSTEAVVGRMETALRENRLGDVLAEAAKLSPRAAVPAQDWLKKVEARRTVETSLAAVDTALKASLVNAPAPDQKGDR
jgi:hypothetical protein